MTPEHIKTLRDNAGYMHNDLLAMAAHSLALEARLKHLTEILPTGAFNDRKVLREQLRLLAANNAHIEEYLQPAMDNIQKINAELGALMPNA